jgi:hypothetical protein
MTAAPSPRPVEGAYALAYDAARKALVGLLEAHGLRPTAKGGHVVVLDAALVADRLPE